MDRLDGGTGADLIVGRGGDDRLDGGDGFDQVAGGFGRDRIDAVPGDDVVRSRDDGRDVVDCGSGLDRAFVSRTDVVRRCERVEVGLARVTGQR